MKLRVISLLLVIALTALLIPMPASAAATEAADLEKQIRSTYLTALRRSGKSSFNGYCGAMVNWQTYLLGIDTTRYGCDGKNEYDLYSSMGTTTGGYQVKSYPASQYDLRSALNTITNNGTVDAYNILVGFQKTNTTEGSIYGHAMLIHGILDGIVYFAECYNTSLGGKYWAEGTPISCSIDTFCDYYNRWTVFDGIAYFGLKTYADVCQEYSASMYAMATENLDIYSEPSDPGIYEAEKTGETILAGEMIKVSALLKTPGGAFWYQLDEAGAAYVQAEKLVFVADCHDDVQITDLKVPTALRKNNGFVLRGTVSARNSRIHNVQVAVYSEEQGQDPVLSGQLEVDGKNVNLNTWQLDRYMTFRQLEAGSYQIVITAEVETWRLKDGKPVSDSAVLELWRSEMRVITDWAKYFTVTFDGNGGDAAICQTVVANGDAVGALPEASRTDYILTGWSLDPAGLEPVTEETPITDNTTLYAQWTQGITGASGWQNTENGWCYYEQGKPVAGFTAMEDSDRTINEQWQRPGGALVAAGIALQESILHAVVGIDTPEHGDVVSQSSVNHEMTPA